MMKTKPFDVIIIEVPAVYSGNLLIPYNINSNNKEKSDGPHQLLLLEHICRLPQTWLIIPSLS